jgi:hypothetical protein
VAGDLGDLARKLNQVQQGVDNPRVIRAAGMAAKKATLEVARGVSGGDGRLSGWGKRGVKLGAGYDEAGSGRVQINLRPAGVWKVMEDGRRGGKVVRPKRKKVKAFATPYGPRASFRLGATSGKGAITKAAKESRGEAVKAASREVNQILREVF